MIPQTPLRYPGGKARLGPFLGEMLSANCLSGGVYAEPYAGGAGVAAYLLCSEHADRVYINDIDPRIFAFWKAALERTDQFCRLVRSVPLTVEEWCRQKHIFEKSKSLLSLGFATFFLNRTNRSGILNGGVIGGKEQKGTWGINARFNREQLIERIRRLARYGKRISLSNLDAMHFVRSISKVVPSNTLIYFDPPYFTKGNRLYSNFYLPNDHQRVANFISRLKQNWIVSYDDHPTIRKLYSAFRSIGYSLKYSARHQRSGSETMYFSSRLAIPSDCVSKL